MDLGEASVSDTGHDTSLTHAQGRCPPPAHARMATYGRATYNEAPLRWLHPSLRQRRAVALTTARLTYS